MVNVIGLGYIGLPTALMLASCGVKVTGTDWKEELVTTLQKGELTFQETGMEELFQSALAGGIRFSTEYQKAEVYIVSVPTPYDSTSRKVDAGYVKNAVKAVLEVCGRDAVLIIESTVPPGTIDRELRPLLKEWKKEREGEDRNIRLVHAPERILPGNMIHELVHNNRIIGADDQETGEKVKRLYASFCRGEIVVTDIRTAEMAKVVENTYRDINIAFANELTQICREAGLDVYEVIRTANMHPRVNILTPGPGVGGHCISVDPWFLVGDYPGLANIILAARKINASMPEYVLERTAEIMEEEGIRDLSRVGFYGLTYKEDVDDTRESPGLQLLSVMKKHLAPGAKVYDPYVRQRIAENQYFDLEEFLEGVDLVVILAGHREIRENRRKLAGKAVFDTRNLAEYEGAYHL